MNAVDIHQTIDQYLSRLSPDRLNIAAEFLAYLADKEAAQASPGIPDFQEKKGQATPQTETGLMTLEAIMDKTRSVLRDLAEHADTIMAESEPVRRSGMLEVMNRLARRIDQAENDHDLVAIANILYDLTVEIPRFPPDDEPREQYFRLKPAHDGNGRRVRNQKTALQDVFNPSFERIEQAWRNTPSLTPPYISRGSKETPWDMMGIFKDDPTWGEIFDEIERERDKDLVWLGGESE